MKTNDDSHQLRKFSLMRLFFEASTFLTSKVFFSFTKQFDEKSLEKKWWNWNQLDLFSFNDNKFSLSEVSDRWSASRAKMWWNRPISLAWKTSSIGEGRISWAWYIFSFHEWLGKIFWLHKSAADDILGPKKEKCVVISVKVCAYWIKPLNFDALWISQSITFMCRPE